MQVPIIPRPTTGTYLSSRRLGLRRKPGKPFVSNLKPGNSRFFFISSSFPYFFAFSANFSHPSLLFQLSAPCVPLWHAHIFSLSAHTFIYPSFIFFVVHNSQFFLVLNLHLSQAHEFPSENFEPSVSPPTGCV